MALPAASRADHSNVVLWVFMGATVLGTDAWFLAGLHHHVGTDAILAVAGLLGRSSIFVAIGILLEALLLRAGEGYFTLTKSRRAVLHAYWVGVMLFCIALLADVVVFAFAGYHLHTAMRILFSDGAAGVGEVVEATGVSVKLLLVACLGVLSGTGFAILLSKWSRRLSLRIGLVVPRGRAFRAMLVAVGTLALIELVATRLRNPFLWERELEQIPLAFCVVRPRAELASYRAKLRPRTAIELASRVTTRETPPGPDVFFVIVESLRKDVVTAEVMPNFSAFARGAWTFEHATTTGNVTHFSWFGLLCSRLPIYFDEAKAAHAGGSLGLHRLSQAGYQVHLLATPDLRYQNLDSVIFGIHGSNGDGPILKSQFRPTFGTVADRDEAVVAELERQLRTNPRGGHVYLLALDSSHFEYAWGARFKPQFLPYAKTVPITHDYIRNLGARRLVINRYKNSVAWVDSLLGRVFDALSATSRLDNSVVVVTGDHGESFWEHETGTHGSSLTREQLEVGLAMHFPGRPARHSNGVLSLLDVMPTVLAELGLAADGLDGAVLSSGEGSAAAFTFQGWNEKSYHFSLTLPTRRLLFELDREDPTKAQHLILSRVRDLADKPLAPRDDGEIDPGTMLGDLPTALAMMTFLEL